MRERLATGIHGLDPLIEGGLPRGSLTLVAGNPGSGKTIFSAQFLHYGAEALNQNGVYVCFSEAHETFLNDMATFGLQFDKLERDGKFKFLDFPAMMEQGVETTLEVILRHISQMNAQRLVVDSFSAMAQAFKQRSEARIVLHTILGKMTRKAGCTTLLIIEIPTGEDRLGISVEEFIADGLFILKREKEFGIREIQIPKLRGTRVTHSNHMFTLDEGFHIISPFSVPKLGNAKMWEPVPDSDTCFSTGSRDLDKQLGGGYRRGAYVLLEAEPSVSLDAIQLVTLPLAWNFLSKRRGVFILPSTGVSQEEYRRMLAPHVGDDVYNNCAMVYADIKPDKSGVEPWKQPQADLRRRTGGSLLTLIGFDLLESSYSNHLDELFGMIGRSITECKLQGELALAIARPGLEVTRRAAYLTDHHLRLIERNGCIFLCGVKPRTPLFALGCDISKGYPSTVLKPIV